MNKEKAINEFKKYWYYSGEWHNADCDFITCDWGVCNCDTKKNERYLRGILRNLIK